MINLMTKGLPDTVSIGGGSFRVKTDFRAWMHFCNLFEKWDKKTNLNVSFIFEKEIPALDTQEAIQAVLRFAYPSTVVPKNTESSEVRILDYEYDADYIYSAFLGQYGIDLAESDIHWHKFRALLNGLNSSTKLHEIIRYRCYEGKDKDYIRLRSMWELPATFTEDDKKVKEEFNRYFD